MNSNRETVKAGAAGMEGEGMMSEDLETAAQEA
jgi:hypothetical protein